MESKGWKKSYVVGMRRRDVWKGKIKMGRSDFSGLEGSGKGEKGS